MRPFINDENRCGLLRGFDGLFAPLWGTDMIFGLLVQLPASPAASHDASFSHFSLFRCALFPQSSRGKPDR